MQFMVLRFVERKKKVQGVGLLLFFFFFFLAVFSGKESVEEGRGVGRE